MVLYHNQPSSTFYPWGHGSKYTYVKPFNGNVSFDVVDGVSQ